MIDEAIDNELEARVRAAFDEMIPKLLAPSNSGLSDGIAANVIAIDREMSTRSTRGLVAAGLMVAALVVGLVVVAQRDRPSVSPADSTPTATSEPAWYRLIRPLLPERFRYAALTMRFADEMRIVAIDPTDGKALEIELARRLASPELNTVNTTIDEVGSWVQTSQGWIVQTPSGVNVGVSCDIGVRGLDFPGPPNYCDMSSTHPFTNAEIRSVASAVATAVDISILGTDIGAPSDRTFNPAAVGAMIADAVPSQVLLAQTEWGQGDGIVDFGDPLPLREAGHTPETSVRVIHGLYPTPPATVDAAYALYDDAATFWMFGENGAAIRISTTDPSLASLDRLSQLGADILASSALDLTATDPPPSTTIDP